MSQDRSALVLVVERDPYVRELENFFLTEAGFRVEFADHGIHALELAQELRPHAVVTEILVPRLDGLTLCQRLKGDALTNHARILVLSFLAAEQRAYEAGADAFLMKPLSEPKLIETVRRLLRSAGEPKDEAMV